MPPTPSSASKSAAETGNGLKTSFPKNKIKVVLMENIHERAAEILQGEGFKVERLTKALEGDALIKVAKEAHVLGIRSQTLVRQPILDACPRLLTIGCFCIGTNQVDTRGACLGGVPVFNSPFSNTRSVAELTIAEIVALHRRLLDKSVQLHAGQWDKSASGSHEVRGRTLGIVGYGRIGSQVSVLAEAMGMRVIYFDVLSCLPLGNARPVRTLDDLLEQSDVVSLHVPATKKTDRMIGEKQIARMRTGSYLINNARGNVVDIAALAAGLKSGKVAGAALDVFPVEPSSNSEMFQSEIRGLGNVILTPHIGGSTEEAQAAIAEDVATKLVRFMNNGSTTGAVNVPQVDLPEQDEIEESGKGGGGAKKRHHRILHFHRNVPGVLSRINSVMAELGVNIAGQYLKTNEDVGYVVLDIAPAKAEPILERIRQIPETIRVRMLW
ncbi:MAG: phosphoglycerate dehydrogenase [Phycisphaerales bacterium]|nr:phosphoglycerate dehydrogenase [Phycisphaerales bacterium]